MSQIITEYFQLCTVRNGGKKLIISNIPKKNQNIIFTKHEINLWFRERDGYYTARETIIGGSQSSREQIIVIY